MALPPILVELKANSREFVAGMKEAQHEVQKLGTESAGHMQKFSAVGKAALFGIAGVAAVVGAGSLEMADKFEASHAKLEAAVKASGSSMDVWGSQISNTNKYMEKLGFTNAQSEDTLAKLTIALGDPNKAMQVMSTSADLARAKNIDLSDAGVMVARAMEGNARALKQMGIDLPINAKSAENLKVAQNNLRFATEAYQAQVERLHEKHTVTKADLATLKTAHDRLKFAQDQVSEAQKGGTLILDELNKRLGGQSQQYTETFTGKVTVLKTQLEDLGVKIGLALIPMLEKAATVTMDVVNWFEKHATVAKILGVVVGTVLVAAIGAYAVSMATAAVATIAATWPILAIIAAVTAVGVGIYELAKHWSTVWGAIKSFTVRIGHDIVHTLETWGPLALAVLAPFLGIPLLIWQHFDKIKGFLSGIWDATVGIVKTGVNDIVGFVKRLPGEIASGLGSLANTITAPFRDAFAAIAHLWNDTIGSISFHIPHWVPKIGGDGFSVPKIPGYAMGTDFAAGGLALVGEQGPELVNLPRGSKVYPTGTGPTGGGDLVVNINGPVYGADSQELAKKVKLALLDLRRSSGQTLGFT